MHVDDASDGRYLEEQLRQLTADMRNMKGSTKRDAQRLVQLEMDVQNRCECSNSDPLWHIALIVALSTCTFIILRWLERELTAFRQARVEESRPVT